MVGLEGRPVPKEFKALDVSNRERATQAPSALQARCLTARTTKARPGEPERAIADIEGPRLTRQRRELLGVLTRIDAATISQSGLIAEPDGSPLGNRS